MNNFENIMEDIIIIFHNIFKYMIFQRRQEALLWSKGLIKCAKFKNKK